MSGPLQQGNFSGPNHDLKSAWHAANGRKPPEVIDSPPDYPQALDRREHHCAQGSGLRNDSPAHLPIIADGFSETIGVYAKDSGKKAAPARARGQSWFISMVQWNLEPLDPKSLRVMRLKGGANVDVFSKDWGTDPSKVLNPE